MGEEDSKKYFIQGEGTVNAWTGLNKRMEK